MGMFFKDMFSLKIYNSEASNNSQEDDRSGIEIDIEGDAIVDTVTANENGFHGFEIDAENVSIKNVEASDNYYHGMALSSFGNVNIFGKNMFNNNQECGLDVAVERYDGEGSINIRNVQSNGNGASGVSVRSYGGGKTDLSGIEAYENGETGIVINPEGDVLVKNSEASANYHNGLIIYSEDQDTGNFTISCSIFNSNEEYGVITGGGNNVNLWGVKASDNGVGNIAADYLGSINVSESCNGGGCVCKPADTVEPIGLEGLVVQVAGGENVALECGYAWTMLQLDSQDAAKFSGMCGSQVTASLTGVSAENLPAALPNGMLMGSAMTAGVNGSAIMPDGGSVRVTFNVPVELQGKALSILFWDADAGEWVKLPLFGESGFAPSDDAMRVLSGVQVNANGTITASFNFGGTFVLVGE